MKKNLFNFKHIIAHRIKHLLVFDSQEIKPELY